QRMYSKMRRVTRINATTRKTSSEATACSARVRASVMIVPGWKTPEVRIVGGSGGVNRGRSLPRPQWRGRAADKWIARAEPIDNDRRFRRNLHKFIGRRVARNDHDQV